MSSGVPRLAEWPGRGREGQLALEFTGWADVHRRQPWLLAEDEKSVRWGVKKCEVAASAFDHVAIPPLGRVRSPC